MRRLLLAVALLLTVAGVVWQLGRGVQLPLFDFVEYWAAGRLNVEGCNPYDHDAVERLERAAGRTEAAVLMWNPPWVLPLVMPFGLLDVQTAQLLWLLLQFLALVASAHLLWRFYGGDPERLWIAWFVAFTFMPTYFALTAGQISPLILLGLVLFLYAERLRNPLLSGVATLLLAIKPQLLLLIFLALLLTEWKRRRWSLLLSGATIGLLALATAWVFNREVMGQYLETLTTRPPAQYDSPTLGTLLRLGFGREHFWLQFVPPIVGLLWLSIYWWKRRHNWLWERELPLLVFVALLTAAYGAWPFDLVLLLVPVMQVAVRPRAVRLALAFYLALNAAALALLLARAAFLAFVWMTPALLAAYLATRPNEPITE